MTQYVEEAGGPAGQAEQSRPPARRVGAGGSSGPWWRRPWIVPLVALNGAFLLFVLPPYLGLDPSRSRIPLNEGFPSHYAVLVVHILFGTIALVTLCLQVWPWLRLRYPKVHRISGRLYVFAGAIPSALLALVLIPFAAMPNGLLGSALACLGWIVTTALGFRTARQRRYAEHRKWMIYSFAFALQTLWGRVIFLVSALTGVTFNPVVAAEAGGWLSTLVNVAIAHWWLRRTARPPRLGAQLTHPAGTLSRTATGWR
ncbi:DUF2306 domain-containing protein [Micromonospora sp. NPDC048170]|uniref:DUF2306 domain-containing protein n=1 Tax=Micromonospora sp. NPDC048170 TaxID=3154819 RepID=UPI0033E452DC